MHPTMKTTTFSAVIDEDNIMQHKNTADYIVDAATLEIVKRYILHNHVYLDRAELMAIIGISDPEDKA